MTDEFLTVEQACDYLGIKRAYLYRLVKRHGIPTFRRPINGRRSLYRRDDLDKLKAPQPK